MSRLLKFPFASLPVSLPVSARYLSKLKVPDTFLVSVPEYTPSLADQVRMGIATLGESLSSVSPDSFDPAGAGPDILAQFGYDRLDRLDYARDKGLDAKATSILESLTAAPAVPRDSTSSEGASSEGSKAGSENKVEDKVENKTNS